MSQRNQQRAMLFTETLHIPYYTRPLSFHLYSPQFSPFFAPPILSLFSFFLENDRFTPKCPKSPHSETALKRVNCKCIQISITHTFMQKRVETSKPNSYKHITGSHILSAYRPSRKMFWKVKVQWIVDS